MRCVLMVVWMLAAYSAEAQTLWRETAVGMTAAEVLEKVPEAKERPHALPNPNGTTTSAAVENFELAGLNCGAFFAFRDGRLLSVQISPRKSLDTVEANSFFESIAEALRLKYGKEVSVTEDGPSRYMHTRKMVWNAGRTSIELWYQRFLPPDAFVRITYTGAQAANADKL